MLDGTSQDIPELEGMYVTWDFWQCLRWYKSGHPGIFQDKGLEHILGKFGTHMWTVHGSPRHLSLARAFTHEMLG